MQTWRETTRMYVDTEGYRITNANAAASVARQFLGKDATSRTGGALKWILDVDMENAGANSRDVRTRVPQ
jgi:hypothetical protein